MRGFVPAGFVVGAVTATALASAGPGALVPFKAVVMAAGDVSVAFVVDFGSGGVVTACVKVPPTDDGYGALTAFTQQEGEAAPTYNDSNLLCSINDDPSTGCGQAVPGGFDYWSYWHGTSGSWSYSGTGASGTVTNGDVEGWRFEDPGAATPSDPPPRSAPNYGAICGAIVPTTTPPPTPTATSSPGSQGTAQSTTVTTDIRPSTTGVPGKAEAASSAGPTPSGTSSSPTSSPQSSEAGLPPRTEAQSAAVGRARHGSADHARPVVIVAVIVFAMAALFAVATFRWRRRPRMP